MPRTPFNHEAASDLGARLRALREEIGNPVNERIGRAIEVETGVYIPTETVRKAHNGDVDPYSAQLDVLAAFAQFYRVHPDALGAVASARLSRVLVMLGGGGDEPDTLGERKWRWMSTSAGQLTFALFGADSPALDEAQPAPEPLRLVVDAA